MSNRLTVTVLALCLVFTPALAQAQTIPSSRTFIPAWNSAGYPGAIPNDTGTSVINYGAVGDGVADDTAAIRNAISAVASDPNLGMVYFPAGTYKITGTLTIPGGVVLRGERDATGNRARLIFNLNGAYAHCINVSGAVSGSPQVANPQTMHNDWLDIADVSVFAVGDYARVWQDNDPAWDNGDTWAAHSVGQILRITGIASNRLYFENALRADYVSTFFPEIQKIVPVQNVGIDNLYIERADTVMPSGGSTIHFAYAANCWVRGVESYKCMQRHVEIHDSTKIEVTGCYFHDAFDYGGGGHGYGVECSFRTGECLIQDNIFKHLRHSMVLQAGPNGNVYGYNYSREAYRSEWPHDYASDITFHGNRPFANLFEGNIVCFIWLDASHGQPAGPYNTIFRNATTVRGLMFSSNSPQADKQNLVGNDVRSYSIYGSDHFQYGNRVKKWYNSSYNVVPSGTTNLPDTSYYLSLNPLDSVSPSWWTISSAIPTIGIGGTLAWQAFNNPAKARWDGAGPETVGVTDPVNLL